MSSIRIGFKKNTDIMGEKTIKALTKSINFVLDKITTHVSDTNSHKTYIGRKFSRTKYEAKDMIIHLQECSKCHDRASQVADYSVLVVNVFACYTWVIIVDGTIELWDKFYRKLPTWEVRPYLTYLMIAVVVSILFNYVFAFIILILIG